MTCNMCNHKMYGFRIDTGKLIMEGYTCPRCGHWVYEKKHPTQADREAGRVYPWQEKFRQPQRRREHRENNY